MGVRSKRAASAVPSHALRMEHRAAHDASAEAPAEGGEGAEAPRESRKFCDGGGV